METHRSSKEVQSAKDEFDAVMLVMFTVAFAAVSFAAFSGSYTVIGAMFLGFTGVGISAAGVLFAEAWT